MWVPFSLLMTWTLMMAFIGEGVLLSSSAASTSSSPVEESSSSSEGGTCSIRGDQTPHSSEGSNVLHRLLGSQEAAEGFLGIVFGGDEYGHYKMKNSPEKASREDLFSSALLQHYLQSTYSRPMEYETDLKIVKQGQTYFTSRTPAKWSEVQHGLSSGASIVINNVHRRHLPLRQVCSELEQILYTFAAANVYLTPSGGHIGFSPVSC